MNAVADRLEWTPPSLNNIPSDGHFIVSPEFGEAVFRDDFVAFLRRTGGLNGANANAFFLTEFESGPMVYEIIWTLGMSQIISTAQIHTAGLKSLGKSAYPRGYVSFGECDSPDGGLGYLLLCVDPDHKRFGSISVMDVSPDYWGEGENFRGVGYVADGINEFLNGLAEEHEL